MIQVLIDRSAQQTERGVTLVDATHSALTEIVEVVAEIGSRITEIADGTQRQSMSISEINNAIRYLDDATQQNAAMVEEATATSALLHNETQSLTQLVSRFAGIESRPEPQRLSRAS
jgi:methyl-accepting chemotaxis protein